MIVLSNKQLELLMSMKEVIEVVEEAFKQYEISIVTMPPRTSLVLPKYNARMSLMPAYIERMDALGLKVRGGVAGARHGSILLIDPETGEPLVVMNDAWVTEMRTGAVSGVATKYLARKDANVLGMFGAGVQARTQLIAIKEVRNITQVRVYDPNTVIREKFCSEMSEKLKLNIEAALDPVDAVRGCDIIITATTTKDPVFDGKWLEEGTHIIGIGSHHGPGRKELDATTVKLSKLVVDQREACLKEAGDIIDPITDGVITKDHIYAELGEIVAGLKKGRIDEREITLFKSVGLAIQDVATAKKIYEIAIKKGAGVNIIDF